MSMKVFISYSSVDEKKAKQVMKTLSTLELECFLDRKDIDWGDDLLDRITEGLSECSTVIVILSPASSKSQWVSFEVGHATALGKKVLPFLVHPSMEVPGFIKGLHYKTRLADIRNYFESVIVGPQGARAQAQPGKKVTPKERDAIRAERNELLMARLNRYPGVVDCSVFQLDDHTDNGYLLYVRFDQSKTSAAETVSLIREYLDELFPEVPVWGEMKSEGDDSVGFAYTYIDEYNKRARSG
jgi:hypothetical protein